MNRKFLIFVTALFLGSNFAAFGATDTFDTRATLRAAIVITEVSPGVGLNFGTLDVPASGSTVFTIASISGSQLNGGQAAEFTVTGEAGQTYFATVAPASITITGPGAPLTVDNFTVTPASTTFPSANIFVGADVTVPSGQTSGAYLNTAGMTLTVIY